jgi:hypothetical protein
MKKPLLVGAAFVLACVVGVLIHIFTDDTLATYGVAVITMAAAVAALFGIDAARRNSRIRSKVRVKDLKNVTVTGVQTKGPSNNDISAAVDAKRAEGGEITGVKED